MSEKSNSVSGKIDVPSQWGADVADWWSQVAGKLTDKRFAAPDDSELDFEEQCNV